MGQGWVRVELCRQKLQAQAPPITYTPTSEVPVVGTGSLRALLVCTVLWGCMRSKQRSAQDGVFAGAGWMEVKGWQGETFTAEGPDGGAADHYQSQRGQKGQSSAQIEWREHWTGSPVGSRLCGWPSTASLSCGHYGHDRAWPEGQLR